MQLFSAHRLAEGTLMLEIDEEVSCPECGAAMVESDKVAEDGAVFIWYACSRLECTGQWLAKRAVRMCGV